MSYLIPFFQVERALGARETRTIDLFRPQNGIPAGSYGLFEFYCPDPDCDCRRVLIQVVEKEHPTRVLAAIGYGFDRDAKDAGPFLDPMNAQCPYAPALLRLVEGMVLRDASYVARLERHYDIVKRAARDPTHPAYGRLRQAIENDPGQAGARLGSLDPGPEPPPVGRNDPCPCGSGEKYKHCCGRKRRSTQYPPT
jgi:hypothetical protein